MRETPSLASDIVSWTLGHLVSEEVVDFYCVFLLLLKLFSLCTQAHQMLIVI